jgi:hypothetical protein
VHANSYWTTLLRHCLPSTGLVGLPSSLNRNTCRLISGSEKQKGVNSVFHVWDNT